MKKKCNVCNSQLILKFNHKYNLCKICKALNNLNAKKFNYSIEGHQDTPDKTKHYFRLKNSNLRLKIINQFIKNKKRSVLVDIGTGSGEMLISAKKYFGKTIGFEPGKGLKDFYYTKNIKIYNKKYDRKTILNKIKKNDEIFITLNHIIEHNLNPISFLKQIFKDFPKATIYIEVPLYTGLTFTSLKFSWKLWYDQHFALYSLDTLKYLARKINMNILDIGNRVFISESFKKKRNLFIFLKNPIRLIQTLFLYKKKSNNTFMDLFLKDFGYVILKKNIEK